MDSPMWSLVADASQDDVAKSWLAAAKVWSADVTKKVMQPVKSAGLPPDPVMVLSDQGLWVQQLDDKVKPTILGVLRRQFRKVTGVDPPSNFDQSQYVTGYLGKSVNRMSNTPDEVYREVTSEIAKGISEGESIPQLAKRIDSVLTVAGNPTWANRATAVARTEVTAAEGAGALAAGAELANSTGKPMVKTWVATMDTRTRPDHRAADGQTVGLTDPFIVGTSPMQYPGDPVGPAGEVINCRCALLVHAADEPTSTVDRQNP